MKAIDPKFFDTRTVSRNINMGFIKDEDVKKHLKSLPDDAENGVEVTMEELDMADVQANSPLSVVGTDENNS